MSTADVLAVGRPDLGPGGDHLGTAQLTGTDHYGFGMKRISCPDRPSVLEALLYVDNDRRAGSRECAPCGRDAGGQRHDHRESGRRDDIGVAGSARSGGVTICGVERVPALSDYQRLREAVGWRVPSLAQCETALAGTVHAACAATGGQMVGMGRLVGDGSRYQFLVDVAVDQGHQGNGLGRRIVERLVRAARRLDSHSIALVAAPEVASFYESLGFARTNDSFLRWHAQPGQQPDG